MARISVADWERLSRRTAERPIRRRSGSAVGPIEKKAQEIAVFMAIFLVLGKR